MTAAGVAAWLF